jgi:aspartyl-tRNA(Asn)/glutamyl-tRNA(Gln) amidotransferase subunit A
MAETASNLSRLTWVGYWSRLWSNTFEDIAMQSRAHGLSEETQKRIIIGNQILSSWDSGHYYKKAQQIRKEINKAFDNDFGKVNFILSPVTPHSAPLVKSGSYDKDVYLNDMYTVWFSLGKNPTIALPTTNFNWIQISWKYKDDHEVLKCAYAIQNLLPH